jgi:hypothetical protein
MQIPCEESMQMDTSFKPGGRQQRARNNTSNLAGDSCDGIHDACPSLEEH